MKKCAYCDGEFEKLTAEHVVAHTFMTRYYPDGKGVDKMSGYQNYSGRESSNYQKINDVCANCNNVILSELDDYFLRFCEKNIDVRKKENGKFVFHYDFNILSRWLLKTLYNSERKNGYDDLLPPYLYELRRYILNGSLDCKLKFKIYYEFFDKDSRMVNLRANKKIRENYCLKVGNLLLNSKYDYPEVSCKQFIFGQNAFFIVFAHDGDYDKIDEFVSDLFYFHNVRWFLIDSNENTSFYEVSNRNIYDVVNSTIVGNLSTRKMKKG